MDVQKLWLVVDLVLGYSLLGYDVNDYEELFEEKMDLLLKINNEEHVTWNGQFRAPLAHASVIPRAKNNNLPIWRAVGGPPASAIKAGRAGVPMMITTLGGPAINFKVSVDAYREAAVQSGFDSASLPVATTSLFYTAKIHKMHLVNITLTLMLVYLHCAVVGIRNSNLQMQ